MGKRSPLKRKDTGSSPVAPTKFIICHPLDREKAEKEAKTYSGEVKVLTTECMDVGRIWEVEDNENLDEELRFQLLLWEDRGESTSQDQ